MESMKAVVIRSYGGTEVLETAEVPVPGVSEDEVLVRVHAVGVNPLDWKVRAGHLAEMLPYTFPLIPGWDVSGTVEKAGKASGRVKEGDEIYALADIARNGACARYVAVKAAAVAPKPVTVDHVHAASVPMAGLTAWQALFETAGLEAGQSVLIHAAAGGIGTFAVQFARWKGARVTGTASQRNREFLMELGADEVIDYTAGPFEDRVREVDVVLDTLGGEVQERSLKTIRKGGILISLLGPPDEAKAASSGVRAASVFVRPDAAQLAEIGRLIDEGVVQPVVSEVLPLEDVARAHEMSETHHVRGKIVLKVSD